MSSPLRYDERMSVGLITFARHGQVRIVTPFIMAGAMVMSASAARAGAAECRSPGGYSPGSARPPRSADYLGGFTTNVDMKIGSPAFGSPEGAWALLCGAQLARRYGLPYAQPDHPDAQAAYETIGMMSPVVLAHTHFVLRSFGWLEGSLTASYKQYCDGCGDASDNLPFLPGF